MDGEALLGAIHDEAAAAVGPCEDVRCDGVPDVFLNGVSHGAGTLAGAKAFQDEKFEHLAVLFELPASVREESEFAVEMLVGDFELHVVVEPIGDEFFSDPGESARAAARPADCSHAILRIAQSQRGE